MPEDDEDKRNGGLVVEEKNGNKDNRGDEVIGDHVE